MSSSQRNEIAVAEPLADLLVAGYVVLCFPESNAERSVFYGVFNTIEEAQDWAELLSGIVIIHPVHQPNKKG